MAINLQDIYLTSALQERLTLELSPYGLTTDTLRASFLDFISAPEESYEFGKYVGSGPGKYLWHVHMIPLNTPKDLDQWNIDYERYTRCTSDRYLFYAKRDPAVSYLLIDHIVDPGGHEIWKKAHASKLKEMELIADNFYFFNKIP